MQDTKHSLHVNVNIVWNLLGERHFCLHPPAHLLCPLQGPVAALSFPKQHLHPPERRSSQMHRLPDRCGARRPRAQHEASKLQRMECSEPRHRVNGYLCPPVQLQGVGGASKQGTLISMTTEHNAQILTQV